jgi:hypothetical protein
VELYWEETEQCRYAPWETGLGLLCLQAGDLKSSHNQFKRETEQNAFQKPLVNMPKFQSVTFLSQNNLARRQ